MFLHAEVFTQKKPLHREVFTHRSFYIQKFLHKEFFTLRNSYTQIFLRTDVFSQKETFTQRNLHAQTRLHTVVFKRRSFCTANLSSCLIFHDHSPSVIFILSFSCSFGQPPPSFSFHFARRSVRPRFILAPSAAKQTKREPKNKQRLER